MTKNLKLSLPLACLFIFIAVLPANSVKPLPKTTPTVISAEELKKMLDDGADILVIDARSDKDFRLGHIQGAINIPADQVNFETLAVHTEEMTKKLVFYCTNARCPASRIGGAKAIGAGFKYVYEYSNGYEDWKERGYGVTKAQLGVK